MKILRAGRSTVNADYYYYLSKKVISVLAIEASYDKRLLEEKRKGLSYIKVLTEARLSKMGKIWVATIRVSIMYKDRQSSTSFPVSLEKSFFGSVRIVCSSQQAYLQQLARYSTFLVSNSLVILHLVVNNYIKYLFYF